MSPSLRSNDPFRAHTLAVHLNIARSMRRQHSLTAVNRNGKRDRGATDHDTHHRTTGHAKLSAERWQGHAQPQNHDETDPPPRQNRIHWELDIARPP